MNVLTILATHMKNVELRDSFLLMEFSLVEKGFNL